MNIFGIIIKSFVGEFTIPEAVNSNYSLQRTSILAALSFIQIHFVQITEFSCCAQQHIFLLECNRSMSKHDLQCAFSWRCDFLFCTGRSQPHSNVVFVSASEWVCLGYDILCLATLKSTTHKQFFA